MKANIGGAAALIAALLIIIFRPLGDSLSAQGQLMLGGILITLGIWIFRPLKLPLSVGGFFLACFGLAIGLPPGVVFSGFAQGTIWTLISALFFGFVLQKTGLGYRVALMILRLFKPSYFTLVLAWTLIGFALSLLTPSITVRVAIVTPIAVSCCEICRLAPRSKGNSLIMLTAFSMALIPGSGWLSGSLTGPIIQGAFESVPALEGVITFDSWLKVTFAPVEIATLLTLIAGLLVFKPKEPLSEDAVIAIKSAKPGHITCDEIVTAAILIMSFALFFTGSLHHIPSTAVCLGATFLLFAFGIIKPPDIGTGISWDLMVFLGCALGLSSICAATGIIDWLSGIIVPAVGSITASPYLFVAVLAAIFFAWHFIDIATFIPTLTLIPPILPAIQSAYGISPMIFVPILDLACCAYFMGYLNPWALMGQSVAKERSWTAGHLAIHGSIFFAASVIALLVMTPFWVSGGLFG